MTSDKLQKHLDETWMRDCSADDAHDAIWGEAFDCYTVPIAEKQALERDNARIVSALTDEGHAHELWSLAQLMPSEGINEGVGRVYAFLSALANGAAQTRRT